MEKQIILAVSLNENGYCSKWVNGQRVPGSFNPLVALYYNEEPYRHEKLQVGKRDQVIMLYMLAEWSRDTNEAN